MSGNITDFTHVYCDICKDISPCRKDQMIYSDVSGKYIGGDICCSVCYYVVATVYVLDSSPH